MVFKGKRNGFYIKLSHTMGKIERICVCSKYPWLSFTEVQHKYSKNECEIQMGVSTGLSFFLFM